MNDYKYGLFANILVLIFKALERQIYFIRTCIQTGTVWIHSNTAMMLLMGSWAAELYFNSVF